MTVDQDASIMELADAYAASNLTLYLGAGVSVGNGLPSWSQLVLTMYFTALKGDWKYRWRPFPNYLYAIAEWQLECRHEPPEITAQKIRQFYANPLEFREDLGASLYAGGNFRGATRDQLRLANPVLGAVAQFCEGTRLRGRGIQGIVTYNYDNLVEIAVGRSACKFVPLWKHSSPLEDGERPIFHVHGYLPTDYKEGSEPDDIVFTEEQYHGAANDPYSWSNLCQIQCMSSSMGLMIGLSLEDQNMRRLLNALKITPLRKKQFALLKIPQWPVPDSIALEKIHQKAGQYLNRFKLSGVKADHKRTNEMVEIIKVVNETEQANQTRLLETLGITPIWYREHTDVPKIMTAILALNVTKRFR